MVLDSMRQSGSQGKAHLFLLLLTAALGAGMYGAYSLHGLYLEKEREIARLNEVVQRLEAESRIAQVVVMSQEYHPNGSVIDTTIKFLEITRDGRALVPKFFTVKGDVIYFDALVIKFDLEYVEQGEALRGKSICLFRRIFGEFQTPEEGFPVDDPKADRGVPGVYRIDRDPHPFELELWKEFWRYAVHPDAAKEKGVRVIQGEAVYTQFKRNNLYTLTLDHDGGINILVERIPRILQDDP